jgi:HEAT repeat protein
METRRRPGLIIGGAVVLLALIAWLVVAQVTKHRLIAALGNRGVVRADGTRDISVRKAAVERLLAAEKLDDVLPGLPVYKRSYVAEALGQIHTDAAVRALGIILRDQEDAPKEWAGRALIQQGERAGPVLMAALSASGGTKDNAVKALVKLGPPMAARLRFLLDDRDPYAAAAESMAKTGEPGVAALVQGCYTVDNDLRATCLSALAAAHRQEVLPPALFNLIKTKAEHERVDGAIKALGILGNPAGAPALLPFLATDKRAATATSLGLMKTPLAIEPLLAQVRKGDEVYRNAAVLALYRIGRPAFPALVRELKSPDAVMRQVAAAALVGSKSTAVTGPLMAAITDGDPEVRRSAALALGWRNNTAAVAPLVARLTDQNWRVVDAAVTGLGEIGIAAVPQLLTVAGQTGQDTTVSFQVSQALTAMGTKVVPSLIAALSNPNPRVQQWSAVALGAIGDQRAVPALKALEARSTGDVAWAAQEQLRTLAGTSLF